MPNISLAKNLVAPRNSIKSKGLYLNKKGSRASFFVVSSFRFVGSRTSHKISPKKEFFLFFGIINKWKLSAAYSFLF